MYIKCKLCCWHILYPQLQRWNGSTLQKFAKLQNCNVDSCQVLSENMILHLSQCILMCVFFVKLPQSQSCNFLLAVQIKG